MSPADWLMKLIMPFGKTNFTQKQSAQIITSKVHLCEKSIPRKTDRPFSLALKVKIMVSCCCVYLCVTGEACVSENAGPQPIVAC